MEHHKMSNEDINLGDALGAVFGQPTEVAPGITAYGLKPNTDENWLRAKAAIEDQSLVSVGGLVMALKAAPNLSLIPLDEHIPNILIERAAKVASDAHRTQKRWGGEPYTVHTTAVANGLPRRFSVLGYTHDVMEDNSEEYPLARMQQLFPPWVVERLAILTKLPGENYDDYLMRIISSHDEAVWKTKIADLRHNLSDIKHGSLRDKYRLALRLLGEAP